MAGILWYSYFNNLFGFIFDEDIKIDSDVETKFESTALSMGLLNESDTEGCPDPEDDDYDSKMNELHNGSEADLETFNNCLEQEIRADLENQ